MNALRKETPKIFEMQAAICSALSNPVRLHLMDLLSQGERGCGDLIQELGISKANLSQHLSVLRNAGIVRTRKEGVFQFVSLAFPQVKDACSMIRAVLTEQLEQQVKENHAIKKELRGTK